MRRFILSVLCLSFFVVPLLAEDVHLIPHPREVQVTGKNFSIDRNTRIELGNAKDSEDRFAAEQLAEEILLATGHRPSIGPLRGKTKNVIALIRADSNAASTRWLASRNISLEEKFDPEGYGLDVDSEGAVAGARTAAGLFYSVQTLKQLLVPDGNGRAHVQGVHIKDWPAMRYRGVHDDISRGPVPTLDFMKKQIRTAAEFKLNLWSIYLEYTFEYKSEPLIGPREGSLNAAEIQELVAYAKPYHVEIVPEQQAFGHLHHVLKWEKYSELAELPHGNVLTPTNPKTYEFIQRLYAELVPLFPSQFFHIGSDETFELGLGKTKDLKDKEGLGKVYFDHILKVRNILEPYHKRLMFWGDIALRYPELLKELPKDLVVMTWNYNPRENFDSLIRPFRDAGLDVMVCPGVNNWNRLFPDYNMALVNIRNFVRDGQQRGALGMLNTTWDDDGEALFNMTWYGIVFGAAAAWQPGESSIPQFQQDFDWAFYRNTDHTYAGVIENFTKIHATLSKAGVGDASDSLFWADYLTQDGAKNLKKILPVARDIRLLAEKSLESLASAPNANLRHPDTLPDLELAGGRFDYLGMKVQYASEMSNAYWDAYLHLGEKGRVGRDLSSLNNINGLVEDLRDGMTALRLKYQAAWLAENRPYWIGNILVLYDQELDRWVQMRQKLNDVRRGFNETNILPDPPSMGFYLH
ncbi:MAG: family 20 glycosylhydrolase [Acidobacteriia bacterium]|nr:family 20 glycosylhydrolase [Terriglobia bacterium]